MISVCIVSWNVRDDLRRCLASLANREECECIVVDNASHDGSQEMVAREFPNVQRIANQRNEGFSKAVNQAIQKAKGDILYVLNPDTVVFPDTLRNLQTFFDAHEQAGIVGTKILHPDGAIQKSVRAFPTFSSQFLVLLKLHNFFPNFGSVKKYYRWDMDYEQEQEVDQVMGASFAIRRESLRDIGMFDEKFWIWFEEVDLCKRAKNAGWKVYYTPTVVVRHEKGKSFAQVSRLKRQFWLERSMDYYFSKHHSKFERYILWAAYPFGLLLAVASSLVLFFVPKNKDL